MKLLIVFVAWVTLATSARSMMDPADKIGLANWTSWNHSEKSAFLAGFRLGNGASIDISLPKRDNKPLLIGNDYSKLVKQINRLYADKANKDIMLKGAIILALMEIRGASASAIRERLESERTRKAWAG